MRILIADDDPVSREILEATLRQWGYTVAVCRDGVEAWRLLQNEPRPELAILDWMMPGMDGPEICRKARATGRTPPTYLILLTSRGGRGDVVEGLEAGADDYITKPFDRGELRARLGVGVRLVELQQSLAARVRELEEALANIKQLQGLVPICSYCKKIRNDQNYWQQVESYIADHSGAQFSHGICPECFDKFVKPELERSPSGGKNPR